MSQHASIYQRFLLTLCALALLLPAGALTGFAQNEPSAASPASGGAELVKKRIARTYLYVVAGNRQDRERNLKNAQKFLERAKRLESEGSRQNSAYEKYARLGKLFQDLAKTNEQIIEAIVNQPNFNVANGAMNRLVGLEKEVFEETGKYPERAWLTFEEVERYKRQGLVFTTPAPDIMPYAKQNWSTLEQSNRKRRRGN